MFCQYCGSKIEDGSVFCESCGKRVDAAGPVNPVQGTPTAPSQGMPEKKSMSGGAKAGLAAGITVVVAGLIVVLVLVATGAFGGSDPSTEPVAAVQPTPTSVATTEPTAEPEMTESPEETEAPEETPEPTPEPDPENMTKEQYREICDDLYEDPDANITWNKDLVQMAQNMMYQMDVFKKKEIVFRNLKGYELSHAEIVSIAWLDYDKLSSLHNLSDSAWAAEFNKEELLEYWHQYFDRPTDREIESYHEDHGDTVSYGFGDGEMGYGFVDKKVNVYENDSYYLVAGWTSCEYELGFKYVRVLFRKNEWDHPGTMVYARIGADDIGIRNIKASSRLKSWRDKTYGPWNMLDGNRRTAWCEGAGGVGRGEEITLKLDGKQVVHGISLMNGYQVNADIYKKNGKVSKIYVTADDGFYGEYNVDYVRNYSLYELGTKTFIEFEKPVKTNKLTIMIEDAVRGNKYSDTCISELSLY